MLMGRKKTVGSSGKFGPRYGMRLRRKWLEVDKVQKAVYQCPTCKKHGVTRAASGIWECGKCGAKFSGGAYIPVTSAVSMVEKALKKSGERENV